MVTSEEEEDDDEPEDTSPATSHASRSHRPPSDDDDEDDDGRPPPSTSAGAGAGAGGTSRGGRGSSSKRRRSSHTGKDTGKKSGDTKGKKKPADSNDSGKAGEDFEDGYECTDMPITYCRGWSFLGSQPDYDEDKSSKSSDDYDEDRPSDANSSIYVDACEDVHSCGEERQDEKPADCSGSLDKTGEEDKEQGGLKDSGCDTSEAGHFSCSKGDEEEKEGPKNVCSHGDSLPHDVGHHGGSPVSSVSSGGLPDADSLVTPEKTFPGGPAGDTPNPKPAVNANESKDACETDVEILT